MMKCEFEEMIGKEVSYETFRIYEEMYLALPENITKQQFVKMLNISAIPESEEAIERKAEAASFKQMLFDKIENLRKQVKDIERDIIRYKEYEKVNDWDSVFWKTQAKNSINYAKHLKAEIASLKMMMA